MKDLELKELWEKYHESLQANLKVNQELLANAKRKKASSIMNRIIPKRIFAIIIGVLWVLFVNIFVLASFKMGEYIIFTSLAIHVLVTSIAIAISLYHIAVIYNINGEERILKVQKSIANFRMTTLLGVRLSFLQIPVFTTFYITRNMLQQAGMIWWVVHVIIFLIFLSFGIWSFQAFTMKNSKKRWFKFIIGDQEWKSLSKAEDILTQIKEI